MKKTAFIICEYDPFHNGHFRHIQQTRAAGAENIVCIMSGNYMQRGTPALCDKALRTRFAVDNGADLVLELPLKYAVSGAYWFAKGAFEAINAAGIAGTLSFGASADTAALKRLTQFVHSEETNAYVKEHSLKHGTTRAASLFAVAKSRVPDIANLLLDANNVLALEYINAANQSLAEVDFFAVKRNVPHDSAAITGNICSAKAVRECYYNTGSFENVRVFLPESVYAELEANAQGHTFSERKVFSAAAMARLVSMSAEDFRQINGVNQGLENRIVECLRSQSDLYELFNAVKTKRFTHARIRQVLLSAVLGIKKQALERPQPYLRVLGMNGKGRALINEIRANSPVPVIMNLSEAEPSEERELDAFAGKLYDICRNQPCFANSAFSQKPYVSP